MSLALSLALKTLAPAVAKRLLDAIDIDSDLANKVLEQAIDVGIPEVGERQAFAQKIQQIAGQLETQMLPLFEQGARNLDRHSRNAILLGVAETLIRADLSPDVIVGMNLDADRLYRYLLRANSEASRDFSGDETALYDRALSLVSQDLIAAAPQLEGFALSVTQITLRQLDELVQFVQMQKRQELQKADQFLTRYRDSVVRELDKPDVFGVPQLRNLLNRQRLCEAYVQLSIAEDEEEHHFPFSRAVLQELHHKVRAVDEAMGEVISTRRITKSRSVDEVISTRRRLVIRGTAGAGKTSLLRWLAVHAARQDCPEPLQNWNAQIPFFIQLRSWVGKGFPAPSQFVQPLAQNIVDLMPEGWVRSYLDRGWALVSIDGVDELPREERQPFFEALQRLVADFPEAIYMVTSRPAGLKDANGEEWQEWEEWVRAEQFTNCTLEPMSLAGIEQFITRWHESLPVLSQPDPQPRDLTQVAEGLKRQLRQRPELRPLAATPLLCAMICALHYENEGTLPSTRIRLYEECVTMLLQKRDEQRGITPSIALNLDQKVALLRELAYWLMRNSYSDAESDQVDRQFSSYLKDYDLPETVTGREIRLLFLERSGLLREPVFGRIDFVHRTFQEYLAAQAIIDNADFGFLWEQAEKDSWREVVIIVAGLARHREREALLTQLLERAEKNADKKHYLSLLAVACLETSVKVEQRLRTRILDQASALLPPQDEDEAVMVARAGDAIVPLLQYSPQFSIEEACNCIAALARIGSSPAMKMLVAYAEARFDSEIDELSIGRALGQAWDYFDRTVYARDVLSRVRVLYLSETEVQDLTPLAALSQLQVLDLNETQVQDLTPLAALSQLQVLNLSETEVQDLTPLAALSQLQALNLSETQVQDLDSLKNLTSLEIVTNNPDKAESWKNMGFKVRLI